MSAAHTSTGQRAPQAPRAPSPRLDSAGLPVDGSQDLEALLDDANTFLSTALGAFERLHSLADSHEDGDVFHAALFTLRSAAQVFAEAYVLAHRQRIAAQGQREGVAATQEGQQ